jgi:hypothetical protein
MQSYQFLRPSPRNAIVNHTAKLQADVLNAKRPMTYARSPFSVPFSSIEIPFKRAEIMHELRKRVQLSLELPVEIDVALEKLATQFGSTKSEVVCRAIALMQQTMAESTKAVPTDYTLSRFLETFGAWKSDRSPEEIIEDIYTSRTTSEH